MSDIISPVHPGRPIHPRPKRTLRSRLSPEQADSIVFPPVLPVSKPLIFPFNESPSHTSGATSDVATNGQNPAAEGSLGGYRGDVKNEYQFRGLEVESDDEDGLGLLRRYHEQRPAGAFAYRGFVNGGGQTEIAKYPKAADIQPPPSSTESIDGYDSFENTNNKKKRKIPTSGSLGNHHSSLSADMAQMGISSLRESDSAQADAEGGVSQYYGSGHSATPAGGAGTGISGAGRGRFGRSVGRITSGRSPLGVSTNGSNAAHSTRNLVQKKENGSEGSNTDKDIRGTSDQGIISAAIASAAALPRTPSKGQENVSLLEQQSSKRSSSSQSQFTFTCDSDSSKGMTWPSQQSPTPPGLCQTSNSITSMPAPSPHPMPPPQLISNLQDQKGFSTQGTQTSPTMANQSQATAQSRRPRRSAIKQAAIAARQRRLQQEIKNYHHPPSKEDIWICEFCEYESIFGTPPQALVRQYEHKDRQERRRLAEKRRLLEKAKMKGKKGKKGGKNPSKNANAATQPQHPTNNVHYDQQLMDQTPMQHQGTQSEEYLADEYAYDPVAMPPVAPSKIPQPILQQHSSRSAVGDTGIHGGRAPVRQAT